MSPRLPLAIVMVLAAAIPVATQPQLNLTHHIDTLSAFDYATRMNAARMLRRAPAADVIPVLTEAARGHSDQFVRFRALVLLTSFNAKATGDVMRTLLTDRNDRVREVAYRWFERHPDPALTLTLIAALETEQAEFVRPALVRAVAALPPDTLVQRALVAEVGRGFDFFRSAVIEALGERRAGYAVDALASVADVDGPLQDDAVLALGRIGTPAAERVLSAIGERISPLPDVPPMALMLHAADCLVQDPDCDIRIAILSEVAADPRGPADDVRLATDALVAIADRGIGNAREALYVKVAPTHRDVAALGLAKLAVRQPADLIAGLAQAAEGERALVIDLLREGFERLEEDFAEEQFYAAARAAYWSATDGSATRTVAAALIDRLDF